MIPEPARVRKRFPWGPRATPLDGKNTSSVIRRGSFLTRGIMCAGQQREPWHPFAMAEQSYRGSGQGASDASDALVALEPITRDSASILHNLFELYAYDFSEHMPLHVQRSGRFELTPGEEWWTREDHFPFLIEQRGQWAGFALARKGSRLTHAPEVMDVAEFFVLRGVRARGIGRSAAHALFEAFPGEWEVRVRSSNGAALRFWSSVAGSWVGQPVASRPCSVEGVDWNVLRFAASSGPRPARDAVLQR